MRDFKLGDLFVIKKTKSYDKLDLVEGRGFDYITRTVLNRGVCQKTGENSTTPYTSRTWSLELLSMKAFYRESPWYAGQFIRAIYPKHKSIADCVLWFETEFDKQRKDWQSVLVRDIDEKFQKTLIPLPIALDEHDEPIVDVSHRYHEDGYVPDFEYMRRYIRAIQKLTISDVSKYTEEKLELTKKIVRRKEKRVA